MRVLVPTSRVVLKVLLKKLRITFYHDLVYIYSSLTHTRVSMVQRNPSRTYIIRTESFLERERQEREMKRELERLEKEKMDKVGMI